MHMYLHVDGRDVDNNVSVFFMSIPFSICVVVCTLDLGNKHMHSRMFLWCKFLSYLCKLTSM